MITTGKTHDIKVARGIKFDAGTVGVFDKRYIDYKWWQQLDQQGVFFVSRLKKDARFTVIQDRDIPPTQKHILKDQEIVLPGWRQLVLRPLERVPFVAEFASGGSAVEPPVDLDAVAVHAAIPCPAFPAQRLEIRDSSGAKALPREDADFDFRLVEPASVGRGIVNRESVPDFIANLRSEDVRQRLATVDVEVIHDQVNGLCLRVLHGQIASNLCELKG